MIRATMFQTTCEVQIKAIDQEELMMELNRFKEDVAVQHRRWNEVKKVWVVRQPYLYRHIKYIDTAIFESERQGSLF